MAAKKSKKVVQYYDKGYRYGWVTKEGSWYVTITPFPPGKEKVKLYREDVKEVNHWGQP